MRSAGDPVRSADLIDQDGPLSIRRQCGLLGISRSQVYAPRKGESGKNLELMRVLDEFHLEDPSAGSRRMRLYLKRRGHGTFARSRIQRLMRLMGIEAAYPRKRTTIPGGPSGIHPYLLRNLEISRPNQVWCADITYIPMFRGFMYLFAVLDWYSRKVIAWELSNTLETDFCIRGFKKAVIAAGTVPEIFNTDQGCQFTSDEWIKCLKDEHKIRISMDGKGRWVDNVIVERFWRSLKYENVYLNAYENGRDLEKGIASYIQRYNRIRPHQSLYDSTPDEIYSGLMPLVA